MSSWGESGTLCKSRTRTHLRNQNKEEAQTQSALEDSWSPPKEGSETTNVSGTRVSGISSCCSGRRVS